MGEHARKAFWISYDTQQTPAGQTISIVNAGMSALPTAAALALEYTLTPIGVQVNYGNWLNPIPPLGTDYRTFTLEHVPPNFRALENVAKFYAGKAMIHNEYARYCDPHANVTFDSPVDSAIHKSIQLLGVVHKMLPNMSVTSARFLRSMASVAQRLHGDEDQLLGIMTLMRSLQVDGEFERYFHVPARKKKNPMPYSIAIPNNATLIINWPTKFLPLGRLVPAPTLFNGA